MQGAQPPSLIRERDATCRKEDPVQGNKEINIDEYILKIKKNKGLSAGLGNMKVTSDSESS